jgi:ATP/ADP translocase
VLLCMQVYISLDEEGRTKGKAAIDVVGSQAGKSGGSVLQQVSSGCGTAPPFSPSSSGLADVLALLDRGVWSACYSWCS